MLWARFAVACLVLAAIANGEDDLILTPTTTGTQHAALIFIQGASIPVAQYLSVLQLVQQYAPFPLWVAAPAFWLDVPEPLVLSGGIQRVLTNLTNSGMPSTAQIFYAGHSLGGAMIQDYVNSSFNANTDAGLVLWGAFITRKYRAAPLVSPTLTIGGELDGLCRLTRIAEAYHVQVDEAVDPMQAISMYPVVALPGQSHMQFASGTPPPNVKSNDLQPEVGYDYAHQQIALATVAFMTVRLNVGPVQEAFQNLTQYVKDSASLLDPIISALLLEGFAHFKPPCYDNPCTDACYCGCPWTEQVSQPMMSALDPSWSVSLNVTDGFHPVWQIPVHLPNITNNCTGQINCVLQSKTVTEGVYDSLDFLDTGFYPTSASELRTKMTSREWAYSAAGQPANFNITDAPQICASINDASYQWALAHAPAHTLSRFASIGVPYVMGDDLGPYDIGPLWIWDPLNFTSVTGLNAVTIVSSPMMKTPLNYFISAAAGFHYCKVLSPARAIEWLYIDGLRLRGSINNSTVY